MGSFISVVLIIAFLVSVSMMYNSWQINFVKNITSQSSNDSVREIKVCSKEFGKLQVDIVEGEVVRHIDGKDYYYFDFGFDGGNESVNISTGTDINVYNASLYVGGSYI